MYTRSNNAGRLIMWLCLLALITGCGFRLRGAVELPPILKETYIKARDPYSGVARELRTVLQSAGARLVESPSAATAVIHITSRRSERRTLAVGTSGRASEFELFEEVTFALNDPGGEVLLQPQSINTTRAIVFDPNEALGKVSEAEETRIQMRRDLARQMITRINVGMRNR
jgi:LPS-assembly lipoprotein